MNSFNEDLTRLLSDPTRMKIYRAVAEARGEAVTVSGTAEKFDLHPNVARMHLEKLAGAGLLSSEYKKRNGGGRPARQYFLGERVLSFQFPPRDYKLLADITLSAIADDTKARSTARKKGHEIGQTALARAGVKLEQAKTPELVSFLEELAEELGLYAKIAGNENNGKLDVSFFNCVFRELSQKNKKVCELHQNLFIGICESLFGKVRITGSSGIAEGENCCNFRVALKLKKK